ncbi:CPBP family intramembrane glutamic endopeptidase [Stieleria varia]|uniref:CAAX prenyl protease 2/Lysostaphin resistance protein A-like domain-containing protein n=1 Tax=Stieleria varia TaxID=2528005 RepID=A0A5C6ALR9_9BACT|nr:CPBP family intramembrane glutamic endopeptidase [Stieleria varia]TWU00965.1 hypothetical protein Pla52n_43350 [Stieleria varia]
MKSLSSLASTARDPKFRPTVILLVATPLMMCWRYYGSRDYFAEHITQWMPAQMVPADWMPGGTDLQHAAAVFQFLTCFALLGLIPALILRCGYRERLRDYGLCVGDPRKTALSLLILSPVFLVAGYLGSQDPEVAQAFPINPRAGDSAGMFVMHGATYLLFYLGWEFCFRGFLLFGLRDSLGDANAILVQTMASTLLHIGGPAAEAFGAILGGILWGWLALWSRSLLSGLAQHYLLGISLDYFLCFHDS